MSWLLDFSYLFFLLPHSYQLPLLVLSLACFLFMDRSSIMCMQPVTALVRLSLTAIHRCFALLPALVPFLALGMGSGWEELGYSE